MSGVEEKGRLFEPEPPARAKLFMHGGSQAVRLPKAFRFEGAEVEVRREGNKVVLTPSTAEPIPRTPEERAAFWARIDAMTTEPLPYPPRDDRAFFGPPPVFDTPELPESQDDDQSR